MRAMILAAGRGERMRPLTNVTPKPLLEAGGRTLIARHIEALRDAGFHELVINCAHLGEQLIAALGDGATLGVRITWSRESEALETAGGIAQALPWLGTQPFLVVNADIAGDFDLQRLRRAGDALPRQGTLAHLLLVDNPPHHPRGDFALHAGRLQAEGEPRLTFAGIGVYDPRLFAELPPGRRAPLAPLLRAAMANGQVSGERHAGWWLDVGTPERLAELDHRLRGL